ncbi:hypothetical protein [Jiella pelagia]|uniref:Uncharacterized protein n=1 Tax=Jiella pelagia TaxID=2986949 RepID=A0ABY7BXK8_9HYPH|nr:hypothetical protein [Jiella pelagia]WAP68259.1 hypothetical protein OH818_23370 [Jiella pelagia]
MIDILGYTLVETPWYHCRQLLKEILTIRRGIPERTSCHPQ